MTLLFAAPVPFWCPFLYRSLFIVFSNAACSLVPGILHQQPLFNCLLFVVISIKFAFLALCHCLCFQRHSMFIHGWLFVLMHLQKSHEIFYTGIKQRKLTAGWLTGAMEFELQHRSTSVLGQQKVRCFFQSCWLAVDFFRVFCKGESTSLKNVLVQVGILVV